MMADRAAEWWDRSQQFIRRKLLWGSAYRAASYAKSALWVVPFIAILLVLVIAPTLRVIDDWLRWRIAGLDVAGAQALYETVITLTLSFIVFTFGSLLVAIQVAAANSLRGSSRRRCCATMSFATASACLCSRWSSR